jgi:DNA-binding response OmpR family regulator
MQESTLQVGALEIRPQEFRVYVGGRALDLTSRELALLTALAEREGRIVSREELFDAVWQRPFRTDDRSVDVYVRKLRAKLSGASPDLSFIHTHFGFGYRLSPEPSHLFHNSATSR